MILLNPQLEAFVGVVKHHTVIDAAKSLGLTQTAITQRIKQLEQSLAATLFTRSRRGMQLTPEGQALLRYCTAAQELSGETLAKISGAGVHSEVRISIIGPTSLLSSRLVTQCLPILKKFPQLLLSFDVSDLPNRSELLRNGQVQLAILPREEVGREMDSKLLKPENYILAGSPQWKRRPIEDIVATERIVDFDVSDTMSFAYLRKYKLLKLAKSERHFVNNNEGLVNMLKAGCGYGVLTYEVAKPFFTDGSLVPLNEGLSLENRLALAWYPRTNPPAYWNALVKAIS